MQSKSGLGNGVGSGKDAVSCRGGLGPHPALSNVVVVEVPPKVVFSPLGIRPFPALLNVDLGSVHVVHVVTVGEGGHLGVTAKCVLAHSGSGDVAIDFESTDGVSEGNDASGPSFIERVVRVGERSVCGVELVERSVQFFMVDDAGNGQDFCAGSVAFLRVTVDAGHSAHVAVLLFGPNGGREGESLLGGGGLAVVREVLLDAETQS